MAAICFGHLIGRNVSAGHPVFNHPTNSRAKSIDAT